MVGLEPKLHGSSIVLVGSFNPAIIQPHWLASMDLIRADEADKATIQVISPQVSVFSLSWLTMQVVPEKFIAESLDAAHDQHLPVLVAGIYARLEHTPFSMMGLIWRGHYDLESEDHWHRLGDRLVPKNLWKEVLTSPIREGTPGLRTLVVEGTRPNGRGGKWVRAKIEPSVRIRNGVYVELHEHYDATERGDDAPSALIESLQNEWSGFLAESASIAQRILVWGNE